MNEQALPVAALSRTRRIAWSTPQNQISVPFLKMVRERNGTRRVYPVNPYVEVYRYDENLYGLLQPNLDGAMEIWTWLVVGPGKAMLIGTAFGLGDTRALIGQLAGGKPLIVFNSHAGRDQVLGNGRFETVYCHEYDVDNVKHALHPGAWDRLFGADGKPRWVEFDRADLPLLRTDNLVPVKNGHTFDLGQGYRVEVLWTGGYTPGHAMLLDKPQRRLFPGDAISSNTMPCGLGPSWHVSNGQYANLTVYRDQLGQVIGRLGEYDYLFPAHGFVNLENYVLGDIHETVTGILAQPDRYNFRSPQQSPENGKVAEVRERYVKGFAAIAYTTDGLAPQPGREG